jgi:hypothetical protein
MTQPQGIAACAALQPPGRWAAAAIVNAATAASIINCGGTLSGTNFWTGGYDSKPGTRGSGPNQSYIFWQWAGGASNAYFIANQGASWNAGEPNNSGGSETAIQAIPSGLLNDRPPTTVFAIC